MNEAFQQRLDLSGCKAASLAAEVKMSGDGKV